VEGRRAHHRRPVTAFTELGLRPELLAELTTLGYEEPTPIQAAAIPPLIAGADLLGQAATGTGKTAAFALPLLQRLEGREDRRPAALVLVPTRELATQVSEAVHRYGRGLGVCVLAIYGGQPYGRQLRALEAGVDVVVATPGRALDHLGRKTLDLSGLDTVVLDEADEMLDMGFAEDIETLLGAAPESRQTVLFSATMPARIDKLARRHLREPQRIELAGEAPAAGERPRVRQTAYVVARANKPVALARVLDVEAPNAALVFCRTRDEVDQLTGQLIGRGHRAEALHGGMTQEHRSRVMGRLRAGQADLLIATDVAARGLDVESLTHVINYDVPSSPEAYVHRIGRVGRAGREGVAITLAQPREHRMLKALERASGAKIPVEHLPTVADLRARRLELTRSALEESLGADDLDRFRAVVDAVGDEHDLMEIALAAIRLAHEAAGGGDADEDEIPEVRPRDEGRPAKGKRGAGLEGPTARVFIGAGRKGGLRPQDLVGAITGESSLTGHQIGAIEITDNFALVEVPEDRIDEVVQALRQTKLRGNRPKVRRDRSPRG
jgi:ATP-dependent RNA helicase DeaD